jgi:hypothetical protein
MGQWVDEMGQGGDRVRWLWRSDSCTLANRGPIRIRRQAFGEGGMKSA